MLTRQSGYLRPRDAPAPAASVQLQRDGYALLPGAFAADTIASLRAEAEAV